VRAQLDRLVGVYEASSSFAIAARREGGQLVVQATDQQPFRAYATSETHFFLKSPAAEIDFVPGAAGAIASMVLHQNGHDLTLKRKP
jgi:hypothetical protein